MTVAGKASQVWDLNRETGKAWVYYGPTGVLQRPFIVVADNGPSDMAGFAGKASDAAYDLHAAVTKAGRDLILVGFTGEPRTWPRLPTRSGKRYIVRWLRSRGRKP